MKPLQLIPVPEDTTQCRSIVVRCTKGKKIATVWADRQITFAGDEDFPLDIVKDICHVSKNFTLFYNNLKTL